MLKAKNEVKKRVAEQVTATEGEQRRSSTFITRVHKEKSQSGGGEETNTENLKKLS